MRLAPEGLGPGRWSPGDSTHHPLSSPCNQLYSFLIRLYGRLVLDNDTYLKGLGPPGYIASSNMKVVEGLEGQIKLDPGGHGQISN